MKIHWPTRNGFTLFECLVVVAVVAILTALLIPRVTDARERVQRIRCVSHHKQIGIGFRLWANDHGETNYPPLVPVAAGGTMEWRNGEAARHFQAVMAEIGSPAMLVCPADPERTAGEPGRPLQNKNVSYFISLTANETNPGMILMGDRNLSRNGSPVGTGVQEVDTNAVWGWNSEMMHRGGGNVALADGSVQQVNSVRLQEVIRLGETTNILSIP